MEPEYVYFVDEDQLGQVRRLVDALQLAGMEKAGGMLEEIYNELVNNKVDVNAISLP